ncbi:ABC transporter substrate-binding protein [Breznakiella homolactica]|uniref:Extracellular solute-binding protein n=1 Tax=Breznakiella homolactica TaxID=2798577 RepID=A0A7T7XKS5_9SPIR|nr:extracellular solute-binding protein [Breznakiella homolactica]QQO08125.1 extracellular solute-binding protein [Breznakiella homolactica]
MKKIISGIVILTVVLSLGLASCSKSSSSETSEPRTPISIAWLNMKPNDTIDPVTGITYKGSYAFKELLEKKIPEVSISFVAIPNENWIQKMETTLTTGEADIGWYTNQIQASKWFVDSRTMMANDPAFTEADFEKTFTEPAKFYTRYHTFDDPKNTGAIYGLPYDIGAYYIMYDKKLLEDWGITPPSQTATFDELLAIAQKTTGINPKTGKQNYGTYIQPRWSEWLGVGADIYHAISIPDMDINKLDIAKDVEYIKDSPEVLKYFTILQELIKCAPPGAVTQTGAENWLTPDNNIAVMFDTSKTQAYYSYVVANDKSVMDRFIPIYLPKGKQNVSGFPEVHHVAIAQTSKNQELAWKVIKTIATDKDVLNLIFTNYALGNVPALADTSGLEIMKDKFSNDRYQERLTSTFITDDYWYWRGPIQGVFSDLYVGKLTPEQARAKFYNDTVKWISDKKLQSGK